jgi:hypothetical protein
VKTWQTYVLQITAYSRSEINRIHFFLIYLKLGGSTDTNNEKNNLGKCPQKRVNTKVHILE